MKLGKNPNDLNEAKSYEWSFTEVFPSKSLVHWTFGILQAWKQWIASFDGIIWVWIGPMGVFSTLTRLKNP